MKKDFLGDVHLGGGWVDASGRGKDDLFNTIAMGVAKHLPVQDQVGRTLDLVGVDVAASAMIGGQVKDEIHPFGRTVAKSWLEEVALEDFAIEGFEMFPFAAREVVCHSNLGVQGQELFSEMRTDE